MSSVFQLLLFKANRALTNADKKALEGFEQKNHLILHRY